MKAFKYILLFCFLISLPTAQTKIDQFNWLQGNWTAEKWGGTIEEYWTTSSGNAIIGMFRFVKDNSTQFTEHFILCEEDGNPVLKLRHFNADFTGWEDKDTYVTFSFVEMGDNYLQLDGIRYELLDSDQLRVLLEMENDGVVETEEFLFNRM